MDQIEKGAWIVHHSNKLKGFTQSRTFENLADAGKAGKLLSSIAASDYNYLIDKEKVKVLAGQIGISKRELPNYLDDLEKRRLLILNDEGNIEVLGVSTTSILNHTAKIFDDLEPSGIEGASLELADLVTKTPDIADSYIEEISDKYKLANNDTKEVIELSKQLKFTDYERLSDGKDLLFNGNIFRKGNPDKLYAVIKSLNALEERLVNEVADYISSVGCVLLEEVEKKLGKKLFNKLSSVGFYDITTVANPSQELQFISLPQAFSKYGSPFTEDGLGHAKQLVSALTYGIRFSNHQRGQIREVDVLLLKLIRGGKVGPAKAIGQDYQILEKNGVVRIFPEKNQWGHLGYSMLLLKKDIGLIALKVLGQGDASKYTALANGHATYYKDAETNRSIIRELKISPEHRKSTQEALLALRTR